MKNEADSNSESHAQEASASDRRSPQSSRVSWWINLVVSVAILAGCVFGYTLLGERKRPQRSQPPKPTKTQVLAVPLVTHEGKIELSANGTVVPLREIRLATEVAGRVAYQSENLRAGRNVTADEVLIRLDPTEYQLEVDRLKAQLSQEKAEVASIDTSIENTKRMIELAEKQFNVATSERERGDNLLSRNAISASEVDILKRTELLQQSAFVEQENRRSELISQQNALVEKQALTKVLLARAELDLQRCEIKSPINGRVVTSAVEEQSFVAVGTTFVTIEDVSAVDVRCSLTTDQMVWIWDSIAQPSDRQPSPNHQVPHCEATISYQAGSKSLQWPAFLSRIDGAGIDPQTRTYPCIFQVDSIALKNENRGPSLTRGMFVSVAVSTYPNKTLYEVPETAIRPGNRVWLNVNDQLQIQPVNIVSRSTENVVVDIMFGSSIEFDPNLASVITSPLSDPTQGMPVSSDPPQPSRPKSLSGDATTSTMKLTAETGQ